MYVQSWVLSGDVVEALGLEAWRIARQAIDRGFRDAGAPGPCVFRIRQRDLGWEMTGVGAENRDRAVDLGRRLHLERKFGFYV